MPDFEHLYEFRQWHDEHRAWRNDWKAGRGDIQALILDVLQEKPMHGYEIIRTLEDRSHGMWRPSPGSIYPTLQLLVDQNLVACVEDKGKKTYSLTNEGKKEARSKECQAPWERHGNRAPERIMLMRRTGVELMKTMKHILKRGSDEQYEAARALIESTNERLREIADGKL